MECLSGPDDLHAGLVCEFGNGYFPASSEGICNSLSCA